MFPYNFENTQNQNDEQYTMIFRFKNQKIYTNISKHGNLLQICGTMSFYINVYKFREINSSTFKDPWLNDDFQSNGNGLKILML